MFNRITVNCILRQNSLFSQRCYIHPTFNEETSNIIRYWENVPSAVVLLISSLPEVLMAVYDRRTVNQGILYIRLPPRCFRFSFTICRSRIRAV